MDLIVFAETELIAVARALREVAETNAVFSSGEADFIEAIAAMHGVTLDPHVLEPITPST